MRRKFDRILYVDLDLHHGDGKPFTSEELCCQDWQAFISKAVSRQLVTGEMPLAIEIFLIENPKVGRDSFN